MHFNNLAFLLPLTSHLIILTCIYIFLTFTYFLWVFCHCSVAQLCVQLFVTPRTAARQPSRSFTVSWSLLKLMSIELALCIRWPKYWSFSFSISPSNEYPGLVSFRMDWLGPLAVQGTHKSLLQHHSSKASILQCSAFFMVQLSHMYMTTRKIIAFTIWTLVGNMKSLLSNMQSTS